MASLRPQKMRGNPSERTPWKDGAHHGRQRRDRQGGGAATSTTARNGRIYLACRNKDRAITAKAELEAATDRHIFDIILMDVADMGSVRRGLAAIDGSVDALVMNAGVIGPHSMDLTADGVTTVFATNVLGHVVLLEGLLAEGRLGEVAVFAGSEAVRGVPKLRMKGPSFVSTSADELATVIDGSYFASRKPDFNLAFGQAKYIGALWMAYLARQYPDRRFITVSPGNTTGTQAASDLPSKPNPPPPNLLCARRRPPPPHPPQRVLPSRPTTPSNNKLSRPTRRFRTMPTRPSTASSPNDVCDPTRRSAKAHRQGHRIPAPDGRVSGYARRPVAP